MFLHNFTIFLCTPHHVFVHHIIIFLTSFSYTILTSLRFRTQMHSFRRVKTNSREINAINSYAFHLWTIIPTQVRAYGFRVPFWKENQDNTKIPTNSSEHTLHATFAVKLSYFNLFDTIHKTRPSSLTYFQVAQIHFKRSPTHGMHNTRSYCIFSIQQHFATKLETGFFGFASSFNYINR